MTAAHPAEPSAMLLSDTSWRICLFNRRQLRRSEADISHLQRKGNFYLCWQIVGKHALIFHQLNELSG